MRIEVETTVIERRTNRLKITAEMIREAFGLPNDARVSFTVPGGGDWSNCAFDLDSETPVEAVWSLEETRTETKTRGL